MSDEQPSVEALANRVRLILRPTYTVTSREVEIANAALDSLTERLERAERQVAVYADMVLKLERERDVLFKGDWAALNLRVEKAEAERDEWKREADLSKWPKEVAQEYHRLKYNFPKAEAVVEAARGYLTITTYDQDPRTWNATLLGAVEELSRALTAYDEPPTGKCPRCKGHGRLYGQAGGVRSLKPNIGCPECGGTGRLPVDEPPTEET